MSDHGEDVQLDDVELEEQEGEEVQNGVGEKEEDWGENEGGEEEVVEEEEEEEAAVEEEGTEEPATEETTEKADENTESKEGADAEKKDDKEGKDKKRRMGDRFFYPSANEYKEDLIHHFKTKGVAVGPVELTDLSNEKIFESLQNSERFCIRFLKETPESDFCGHLMLYFDSEDTAVKNKQELGNIREEILVKHLKPLPKKVDGKEEVTEESEDDKVKLDDIRKGSVPHKRADFAKRTERTIVVTAIPATLTEEKIKEAIPNAESIYIPKSFVTGERKGYAYVELPTKEDVAKLDNSKVEFGETECRLKKLDTLLSVGTVVHGINVERKVLAETGAFTKVDRERMLKLYRQGVHYERVDYLDDKQKEGLKKAMEALRKRMAEDRQAHRKGGGRGGSGGGGAGNQRGGMKRPNQGRLSPAVANKRGRGRNFGDGGYGGGNYGGGNYGMGMGGGMGMGMGGGMGMGMGGGMGMDGMGMGMGGGGYNQRQGGRNSTSMIQST